MSVTAAKSFVDPKKRRAKIVAKDFFGPIRLSQRQMFGFHRLSGGEYADEFDSFEVLFTMRCACHVFCQILARCVFTLMISVRPQVVVRDVVHLALVSDVGRSAFFSIVPFQFF